MGAKKRRAPPSDHTVAEKMSHDGNDMRTIIRRCGFDCRNGHDIIPLTKILVDESVEKHEVVLRDDSSEQKSFYPRPVDTITLSMRMPSLSAEKMRGGRYGWAR